MKNKDFARMFGVIAAICGVCLMIFGIYRGETAVVLQKAVNICLECIGIG